MKLNDYRDQVQGNKLEQQLIELGGVFPYPQTPNISAGVMHRSVHPLPGPNRPRLMLVVALVLLGLFIISIPPVRAAVVDFLQLGKIRIELENDQFLESVPAEPPSSNFANKIIWDKYTWGLPGEPGTSKLNYRFLLVGGGTNRRGGPGRISISQSAAAVPGEYWDAGPGFSSRLRRAGRDFYLGSARKRKCSRIEPCDYVPEYLCREKCPTSYH